MGKIFPYSQITKGVLLDLRVKVVIHGKWIHIMIQISDYLVIIQDPLLVSFHLNMMGHSHLQKERSLQQVYLEIH